MLVENNWATEKELKVIEKEIRASITKDVERALKDDMPGREDLYTHIATSNHYVRGVTHDLTSHDYDI